MTSHPLAPDWQQLKQTGDERLAQLAELDDIYVLWPRAGSHWTLHLHDYFAHKTYLADPRFRGYCVVGEPPGGAGAAANPIMPAREASISFQEFTRQRRSKARVGLLDFCGTITEWALWRGAHDGIFDFLAHAASRDAVHTYVPLSQERNHYLDHAARYEALAATMDARSARTLFARMQACLTLDRGPILRTMTPMEFQYFNGASPQDSFVPRPREVYVDAGASQGEQVLRMAGLLDDLEGSQLWALEPNRQEFRSLQGLRWLLPLRAQQVIVSDDPGGQVLFRTVVDNPTASHIVGPQHDAAWREAHADSIDTLPCVTLDELIARPVTFIKADVEGGEMALMRGARGHLARPQCRLSIAAYHYPGDLLEMASFLHSLGRRRLSLRAHHPSLYDLVLYAHEEPGF